jgi:hypothetical protein
MLTDSALRNLKPKSKIYKASDRDGMYVTVSPSGTITFRYDYRLHGRRETLTLGRYGSGGISLAMARELLLDARKAVLKGVSPVLEKQREKRRMVAIKTFGTAMDTWLANARLTACAAPCWRRCRAIPPEQPEHEDVARIQFAGCHR